MRFRRDRRASAGIEPLESRLLLSTTPLVTEFMASNDITLADGDGNYSDWIEIYNPSESPVDLSGWHLTDEDHNLDKWTFPDLSQSVVDPGEYVIVFASGQTVEDYVDPAGNLHTDFRLTSGGEYLALTDPVETIVHEYAPQYPPQEVDVSYGINPDDLSLGSVYFAVPTPGLPNSVPMVRERVTFSHFGPTFTDSFELTLSGTAHENQLIYYTTDGSEPGLSSSIYTDPLTIDATTQVRARIREAGFVFGPVTTESFSRLGSDAQAFSSQLPILLIDNFGQGDVPSKSWNQTGAGIHQVPRQAAAITVFGNGGGMAALTGTVDLHSRSGIRTRGAYSTTFPEPQYALETWSEVDDDADVAVFGMAPESDWILYAPHPTFDQTLMNNQFLFALANQMSVWSPQVQYVETFLNTAGDDVTMDDHVGLYVWTEKVKRDPGRLDFAPFAADGSNGGWLLSINRMDPIPEDDPTASPQHMHTPGPNGVLQTPPNSSGQGDDIPRQYNAFINFEHPNGYDLNPTQRQAIEDWFREMEDVLYGRAAGVTWNDPVDGYAKYIDVDNFIDYFIVHNLSKNSDGLLLSMWIYNPDPNNGGRLKFGPPWDHDLGSYEGDATASLLHRSDRLWYARLFQDDAFVQRYQDRWQMWRQTVLSDSEMNQVFDDYVTEIGNEAVLRDGVTNLTSRINTVKSWLAQRAAAIDQQFIQPPVFSRNGGEVPTGFDLFVTASFGDIYYTTDGSDPRLANGSVNPNAILFDSGSQTTTLIAPGSVWSYLDDGSNQGTAWSDVGFNDNAWSTGNAQLGYGDGDEATVVGFIDTDPGASGVQKNFTTYFRSTFEVVDADAFTGVTLRILRDDGAAVYINGTEVVRSNMPGTIGDGTIGYTTPASGTVSGSAESTLFFNYLLDPSVLLTGENTIAVEIHQSNAASSDISFDLELLGNVATGSPITLDQSTTMTARTRNGSDWSGLAQADFFVGVSMARRSNMRIAEVNYNPHDALPQFGEPNVDQQLFEFVELVNVSTLDTVDLKNTAFVTGIDFTFDDFTPLAPGERVLVVRDIAAFESRYGSGLPIAGVFAGDTGLADSGETIKLDDATGSTILEFTYHDGGEWPDRADGPGSSLVVHAAALADIDADFNAAENWRASTAFGGTPGTAAVNTLDVIVNEILAHADVDAIELYNTSGQQVDLSSWWLSDTADDYFKYQFAPGSTLGPGGYLVLDESDFNPGGGANDFALSAAGDEVWLLATDVAGKPIRFADSVSFAATLPGVSLGRVPNGDPSHDLFPLTSVSLGGPNDAHQPGAVIISEVHYHPAAPPLGSAISELQLEFVELYNRSGTTVNLADWRLRGGVDLDLPAGTTLASGEVLVLVPFDPNDAVLPDEFRTIHNISGSVPLIGPYSGQLKNGGETVRLLGPTAPPDGQPGPVYYLVDRVAYDDEPPWPTSPDGSGDSLGRMTAEAFGDFATSWLASPPTPGSVSFVPPLRADFDADGDVDGDDFLIWQTGFGQFPSGGATVGDGDADRDGDVDGDDFLVWQAGFGSSAGGSSVAITLRGMGPPANHAGIQRELETRERYRPRLRHMECDGYDGCGHDPQSYGRLTPAARQGAERSESFKDDAVDAQRRRLASPLTEPAVVDHVMRGLAPHRRGSAGRYL